ncbi:hypothetical protein J5N97_020589 [Dioscorea zingiberensis]|uniref:Response regulatory domain-containing protein n=1 Tax=Dioscorea zingiberensis TaxID=325984 RepID=A0A9D5HDT5_9LILI|nr:hypothetical protein J5N97_020589 [Dioscorea zingiberensis]
MTKCRSCSPIRNRLTSDIEPQYHVLAVDDSLLDRKLIERLLKTSSYQVTTMDSGSKALEFLELNDQQRTTTPSVSPNNVIFIFGRSCFADLFCLPGMTGYDLLKTVKESSSLKDIHVVIMSSENVPARINRVETAAKEKNGEKNEKMSHTRNSQVEVMHSSEVVNQSEKHIQTYNFQNQANQTGVSSKISYSRTKRAE